MAAIPVFGPRRHKPGNCRDIDNFGQSVPVSSNQSTRDVGQVQCKSYAKSPATFSVLSSRSFNRRYPRDSRFFCVNTYGCRIRPPDIIWLILCCGTTHVNRAAIEPDWIATRLARFSMRRSTAHCGAASRGRRMAEVSGQ